MHLTFAFRFPPLSRKEKRRREEIAKGFIGQWMMTSDLPFVGNLYIQSDGKNFKGSIEFSKEFFSGEIKELPRIDVSGEKIVFGFTRNGVNIVNTKAERWLCFGQLKENAQQIEGKIHIYKLDDPKSKKFTEFNWSATKVI